MEIATQDKDLINKVTAQYQPYILAQRTPDLKSQSRFDNLKSIYKSIVLATEYTGSLKAEDEKAYVYITEKFLDECIIKYPYARHGEIELAFRKGALKEFGEYFGINVQTCWGWFKKYMESRELLAAKREWIDLIELPKTDKPIMRNLEEMKEPILNAFNEFKIDGRLPYTASSFYSLICQIKGVKSVIENKELRTKIRNEALQNYRANLVSKKTQLKDRKQFDDLLEWAAKGINASYDTETRRVALKYYFEECINTKTLPI